MKKSKKAFLQNSAIVKVNCRGFDKKFSTNFTRNKHEHATGHGPIRKVEKPICYDSFNNLYLCPTENCEVNATTKRSIKRHLKNCKKISQNKKKNANNKVCKYSHKTFLKKSNRDRHHCVKSVRIRSYSGPSFLAFGLNTVRENMDLNNSEYGHFLHSSC